VAVCGGSHHPLECQRPPHRSTERLMRTTLIEFTLKLVSSIGGQSQSWLFRKHRPWFRSRWTAASVGDRIKCADSAIRCGCRAFGRIHAIFFILFFHAANSDKRKRGAEDVTFRQSERNFRSAGHRWAEFRGRQGQD
jgi:hypothetical protein